MDLATSSPRSPSLFAYYAALNLLNAPVLFSNLTVRELFDPAVRANRAALERHHLFPVAYLRSKGIEERRSVNQIANYALLEWGDNAEISDLGPEVYFPQFAARVSPEMLRVHALPLGWEHMEYEAFLEKRRLLMAGVIKEAFELLSGARPAQPEVEEEAAGA
jgi:hypothetical protein